MYHLTRVDCTYETDFCVRQRCKAKPFVLFQLLCSGVLDAITVNVRNDTCAFPGLTFAIRHEVRFVIKKEVQLEISVKMHKSMSLHLATSFLLHLFISVVVHYY